MMLLRLNRDLLYDTQKIPVTEDLKTIYTLKKKSKKKTDLRLELKDGRLFLGNIEITFTRRIDEGDTYNFGAVSTDYGEKAEIISIENYVIKTSFFDVKFYYR